MSISVLLGMADLAAEYGNALVLQLHNQRVADISALAGALAYTGTGSSSAMQSAGNAVAALNGAAASGITIALTTSSRGDGNNTVQTNITTPDTILLTGRSLAVSAVSYVELQPAGPPCILALKASGTGITLSGGTQLTATSCVIASNASEVVPCGTYLVSDTVEWDSVAPTVGCGGITPSSKSATSIRQVKATDPYVANSAIISDTARLSTVSSLSAPAAPSASGGTALSFGFTSPAYVALGNGCAGTETAAYSGVWSVTCPAGGIYNFGSLLVVSGASLAFDTTTSTYNFSGLVWNEGNAISFGSGTFNMAGGLLLFGTGTFGQGTFNIGPMATACYDNNYYSICTLATLTIGGPALLTLQAGLYVNGGTTVSIGAGSAANSYIFGASSAGYAISLAGGSTTTLGDATSGLFQLSGGLYANGGVCLTLPAAAQHDINGNVLTAGGVVMGAGTYTITGYFDAGGNGGGDVNCPGSGGTVGIRAANTTLVIGGASTPGDNCSGSAFCVGSGFNTVTISAPTSGTNTELAVIGPTNGVTAGVSFTAGATNTTLSGLVYFPNGPLSLSGAASIGSPDCLELIATQITSGGGSATGTNCPSISAAKSSYAQVLVQ